MPRGDDKNAVRLTVVGVFEQRLRLGEEEERLPLVVLSDGADRELRVPVGSCEGMAIHVALQEQLVPRPLTHDLAIQLLRRLSAEVDSVVIEQAGEGEEYRAGLQLATPQGELRIEARPGDALAIAVRAGAPIFANESMLSRRDAFGGDSA